MGVARYDFGQSHIDKFKIDPQNGFLIVRDVPITLIGVRKYRNPDGTTVREAKTPEELLSKATVDSANGKPITDDHPKDANGQNVLVTKDNYPKFVKGYMGTNAHVADDGTIRNDMTIMDPTLINEIRHGKEELSIGFEMELDPTKGKLDGTAYDAKQTNIRINHVAVVEKGRAGHKVRLSADSDDAVQVTDETPNEEKGKEMEFTKVHSKEYGDISVATQDADKLTKIIGDADESNSKLEKLKAERDKINQQIEKLEGSNDKSKKEAADAKKKADEARARADAAEEENKSLKSQLEGDAFEDKLNNTLAFREKAKKIVGDSFDFTGKSEREVEEAALKTKFPDRSFDSESDDYVRGYYENLFTTNAGGVGYGRTAEQDSEESAYQKALEARQNLYEGGE